MSVLDSRGLKVGSDITDVSCSGKGSAKSDNKELVRAVPWRVFINHIDSYHARQLADLLSTRSYIPTKPANEGKEKKLEGENDEEEEEEEKEEKSNEYKGAGDEIKNRQEKESPRKFELVATAVERENSCPPGDVKIIPPPKVDKQKFISELLKCGFIIYDITQDKSQIAEANWVLNELVRALDEQQQQQQQQQCRGAEKARQEISASPRNFIVISSVMTWAGSHGIVAESKHWKRRLRGGHPSYQEELQCERNVAAAVGRKRAALALRACVVCAGLTYGEGEALLQYAFKLAWLNDNWLPVVGHGRNLVPLLHVRDLANAVYAVMREWPKSNYVLAVERTPTTQKALITAVSRALSRGRVKSISVEEALGFRDITERVVDAVTLDLDLRPSHLLECASMEWRSTGTFCDNIDSTVREFLAVRDLQPVKLIILGPPASGKTHLAQALAQHYRTHRISLNRIIPDTIRQLTDELKESEKMMNDDDDGEEEEEENLDNEKHKDVDVSQSLLDEIQSSLRENKGRLSDDLLTKVLRRKLMSRECQNQGYVLDGYPKTLEQARLLFGQEDYPESEEKPGSESSPLLPHLVIALEARDEFLLERLINRSERDLQNSRNTEQRIHQRLLKYRQRNDDEESDTPLQLFDELEIHPVVVDIEQDDSPQMLSTFRYCLSLLGPAHNYGATDEELEEEKRRIEAEEAARSAVDAARRELERAQLREERERRACQWMDLLEKLKEEEEERLRIIAEPLRRYLAKYVFPTLTQALLEVAKLRPNDSIDYLAQYLFKLNPNGRAFEPDYREETNATLETIQQFQDEDVMPHLASREDNFEHPESSDESEKDKCFCHYRSHSTLESNSDISPEEKCNECG